MADNNNTEHQTEQNKVSMHIPWLDRFENLTKQSADAPDPDIDFITRIHELEGR